MSYKEIETSFGPTNAYDFGDMVAFGAAAQVCKSRIELAPGEQLSLSPELTDTETTLQDSDD